MRLSSTSVAVSLIIIISSLPKGRSLASKFSNSLGFQPSSSYHHMPHPIHHRSCPFLASPFFLPFSLLAPISSDDGLMKLVITTCPIHYNMSNPVLLSVPYRF